MISSFVLRSTRRSAEIRSLVRSAVVCKTPPSAFVLPQIRCASTSASTTPSLASLVKILRTETGAPMMDCKTALKESDHDISQAMDWLRKHGTAKASSKVAGRTTNDGLVSLHVTSGDNGDTAALVQVASETDFAGRSQEFVDLVNTVASVTLQRGEQTATASDLLQTTVDNNSSKTLQEILDEAIIAIRENLTITQTIYRHTSHPEGVLAGYIHNKVHDTAGTSAAVVELAPLASKATKTREEMQQVGKKLAMHIVALKKTSPTAISNEEDGEAPPLASSLLYLTPEQVPPEVVAKEESIIVEELKLQGKPEDLIAKIVPGKLRAFYESVCLTEQKHMLEEGNPVIGKYLKQNGMELVSFDTLSVSSS